MSETEKHNPGEPEFGEGHDEDLPHNPGEPTFGDDEASEPSDADEAAENAEGHS
jgi:hypothetical protein